MNLTIAPGAATDDARQIVQIVSDIESDMETLDNAIKNTIPSGIQTTWSETLRDNWESYYGSDVPEAMAEMKQSASNLEKAVEAALGYDQEKM